MEVKYLCGFISSLSIAAVFVEGGESKGFSWPDDVSCELEKDRLKTKTKLELTYCLLC